MNAQTSIPFGDDCCVTSGAAAVTGQLQGPGDTVTVDIGAATALVTVQLVGVGGLVHFETTLDGLLWYPKTLVNLAPGMASAAQATIDSLWQGSVAGWAQFRVRADATYAGTFTTVTLRTTDVASGQDPVSEAPIIWIEQDVVLDGSNAQHLLEPDPARRAFMFSSRGSNAAIVWSPVGASLPSLDNGIPLVAGAQPTAFTFPECGTGLITVHGTAGNIVTVYRGV